MTEEQKTIESLRRKRGNIKASLTRLEVYYSNITAETSSEDISIRLEMLEKAYNEFKDVDDLITMHAQQNSELAEFEDRYCVMKAKLRSEANKRNNMFRDLHEQFNSTMKSFVQQQRDYFDTLQDKSFTVTTKSDEIKLPKITIPPFSGNYAEFPSFKDLFESTIHKNASLSKVHKFKYLKGLLSGEAANIVKHVSITEANYDTMWEKIVKRYHHIDNIMGNLIRQFVTQPRIHGSSKEIRYMADTSDEVLRGLAALGDKANTRDGWLIYLLIDKCDDETKKAWALKPNKPEWPTIEDFIEFLNDYSIALERAEPTQRKMFKANVNVSTNISVATTCPLCNEQHLLYKCDQFLALDVSARRGLIAEKKLCFTCMRSNHRFQNCKLKIRCTKCNRKHHMLLHIDDTYKPAQAVLNQVIEGIEEGSCNKKAAQSQSSSNNEVTLNCLAKVKVQAILPTAVIKVKDGLGQMRSARVLLDSGSQASFVDERFFDKLHLKKKGANIAISGLASSGIVTKGVAKVELLSRVSKISMETELFILERLPLVLPSESIKNENIQHIQNLELADPNFFNIGKIDMLLGADIFFNVLREGRQTSIDSSIIAQNTIFGYIVSGKTNLPNTFFSANHITLNMESRVDEALRRFWEIEEIPTTKSLSPEEVEIEKHFSTTVQRNAEGRFVVRIPFKKNKTKLGNSLYIAKKRFDNLEKKLHSSDNLTGDYKQFMAEYLQLNHMMEIPPKDIPIASGEGFYLPHHAVVKASSTTTKVRVVFDGSCRSSTGVSLNDTMMVGPTLQSSLWDILLRFRTHKYVMTADIEKMYRQILVDENDANYQRILWRETTADVLKHYKLTTVTYGTASAPFLATRCLYQLALENTKTLNEAATIIKNDFYVDDLLTGCDSIEQMQKLKGDVSNILKSAGFELRKWCSNVTLIGVNDPVVNICSEGDVIKILGLQWCSQEDHFSFNVQDALTSSVTKRSMLSEASKIFDPLGWLSPSTILVKIMFQQLWLQKLSWDDQLPENIQRSYIKIRNEFQHFKGLKISRWLQCSGAVEFHVFTDASEKAYAAVVFCRTCINENTIEVRLVTAKTKVAPIRQKSLPRLELCAAVLGTKLLKMVSNSMQHIPHNIFAWTDSAIVLAWLSDHPSRWTSFVGNRTSEILSSCPREKWSHVKSKENPADVATRGILPSQLNGYNLWWNGPEWLSHQKASWPNQEGLTNMTDVNKLKAELRKKKVVILQAQLEETLLLELINKYSSYAKLIRIIAYVIRYCNKLKAKVLNKKQMVILELFLTSKELSRAEEILIQQVQNEDFKEEIDQLKRNGGIQKQSHLRSLNPFLDKNGIMRVGGRLERSSRSITNAAHGTAAKRANQSSKPFENTGVDFTGAVSLANKRGRGAKISKGYIAIFICLATKAIHIEVVTDCSTDGFIAALRRFIARRGLPSNMYSDNGTNFVGADKKLQKMYKAVKCSISDVQEAIFSNEFLHDVGEYLAQNNIVWHYTPPLAPHFAGIWEAAVKSVKSHLARVTSNINLTYEELSTLLCNIEAILNSRPLTLSSANDESYEALTPGHFLIGSPITSLPEPYQEDGPIKFSKMWAAIQQRTFSFWKRFSIEYLHNLQQRNKWQGERKNLKVGDVVLIKEEYLPPCKWALGRITTVHPGKDGHVRVVSIKTSRSEYKRPLNKVVLLPVEDV